MNKTIALGVGLLLLVLLILFSTTFTVKYNEVAIKSTFGQADVDSVIREPGLHFRLPVFVDKVTKLDTRLQLVESPQEEITTKDGLQIVVRAYLLWRVDTADAGPLDFFKNYMSIDGATQSLRDQFRTAFTGALSLYDFDELIGESSRLGSAEDAIQTALASTLTKRGIAPVSIGINQLVLPPKTSSAVLQRMKGTRVALAQAETERGTSEAARITAEGHNLGDKIRAFAEDRARQIEARGAEQAEAYYKEMGQDEELAMLLIWIDTLREALNRNTTLIMPADFAPMHLLGFDGELTDGGVPKPADWTRSETAATRDQAAPVEQAAPAGPDTAAATGTLPPPASDDEGDTR